MKIYVIDIMEKADLDRNEYKNEYFAEQLILHRDIIRGYTTNYFHMLKYYEYITNLLSEYVDIFTTEYDAPDGLKDYEYEKIAFDSYLKTVEDDDFLYYASTLSIINLIPLDNGGICVMTESMLEYISETWNFESILDEFVYLFDDTLKYIPGLNTDEMILFRQTLFKELFKLYDDMWVNTGSFKIDPYGVSNWYFENFKFI